MQNRTKSLLISLALLFSATIFIFSCIIRLQDILSPILPKVESHRDEKVNDVIISSRFLVENKETEINRYVLSSSRPKIVCYLTIPGERNSTDYLDPSKVDPNLCTHILIGFASIVNCSLHLGDNIQIYKDASNLKARNPDLKVMISVGGMNEISTGFPVMTRNHANRKIFIRSVLNITKTLKIDGLDVDWEFPGWLDLDGRQKIHFIQLLYELKKAFNKSNRKLILSAAVAASETVIDQCYNVPQMAEHVDFINLMTYDYHFYSHLLPITGLNAPLYSNSEEKSLWSKLNVNYSGNYWVEKGMPREKIVVGIPTYGHSFSLNNPENNGLYAPCNGYGELGSIGFISYPIACSFIENGANKIRVNESKVSYAFRDKEWISYDDVLSVTEKANWIRSAGFAGAMIFSLNTDDSNGTCEGNSSFPLSQTIAKIIGSEHKAQ